MKLPSNVKLKKGLLNIFPFSKYTAQAIYPNIYFPKRIYENLKSNKPSLQNIAILIHEQTHIERAYKIGFIIWNLKYIFLPKFRFEEELKAEEVSMKYLKKVRFPLDIDKRAKKLSSYLYLWCVSYKEAKRELEKIWNES